MKTKCVCLLVTVSLIATAGVAQSGVNYEPYGFSTLAGNPPFGGKNDGIGSDAQFSQPAGTAIDAAGNVFVADTSNQTLRMITPEAKVTTLAGRPGFFGSADGTGSHARFANLNGAAVDSLGNIFIPDFSAQTIRKVTPDNVVTTFAGMPRVPGSQDGTGSDARFSGPDSVALDSQGNLFVAEYFNNTIRKITPDAVVSTFAGKAGTSGSQDGTGSDARFNTPGGIGIDSADNLYVADSFNCTIRQITPQQVVTTLAGKAEVCGSADGTGAAARFNIPEGVATDASNNLYVADTFNYTIRKIAPGAVVTTVAGKAGFGGSADGHGAAARFLLPFGLSSDDSGFLFVADTYNSTIRMVTPAADVTTLAGSVGGAGSADGTGRAARFTFPGGIAADGAGNSFVADTLDHTIRMITADGIVVTIAGSPGMAGSADGTGSAARFNNPNGIVIDSAGNLYVGDTFNHTIRKITPDAVVTTFAGEAGMPGRADGTGSAARFDEPNHIAIDAAGNIYVADTNNSTVRQITPDANVTTLAGLAHAPGSNDGTGSAARFDHPAGITVDVAGNIFVADSRNNTIRKIAPGAVVTTIAGLARAHGHQDGSGDVARFFDPKDIAADGAGNLFIADSRNDTIRKLNPGGVVTTIAGEVFRPGTYDGSGRAARFSHPQGVAADAAGNVFVADTNNHTIRLGHPAEK